jgi:uncharacterized protein (DUF302 family)
MTTTNLTVARTDVPTGLSYEALVQRFEATLGTWDPAAALKLVERKAPWTDVEAAAAKAAGSRGLMIIASLDQGQLTTLSGRVKKCRLYLVGNPVIASTILDINPQGALYVPFRVALWEADGSGGARVSFDRPGSSLAALGNPAIDEIGRQLDAKIDAVVSAVCAPA